MILKLIEKINNAWNNKEIMLTINPKECNGYFDFRNKIMITYEREGM